MSDIKFTGICAALLTATIGSGLLIHDIAVRYTTVKKHKCEKQEECPE